MVNNTNDLKEMLLAMYQENVTQCRHLENQRAIVTNSILAIDTLILGLITYDKLLTFSDLPVTFFLTGLGIIGSIFTLKQYERYKMHLQRSREYRSKLNELFANGLIETLRKKADEIHYNTSLVLR